MHGLGAATIPNEVPSIGAQPKFNEICNLLGPSSNWSQEWDDERKVPYMFKGEEWISYENKKSVKEKARYANQESFRGLGFNNLAYDDFEGKCDKNNHYPLLKIAKEELEGKQDNLTSFAAPLLHSTILFKMIILVHLLIH